jgi:hypothetical protein
MRAELGRASPFSSVVAANGHGISDEYGSSVERDGGCHVLWRRFVSEQLLLLTDGVRRYLWAQFEELQLIVAAVSLEASRISVRSLEVERECPLPAARQTRRVIVTKENESSWIFEPRLTCTNALRRVQNPGSSLV